jgi:N-acetylmuramoyl-L-alanine amidase
MNVEELARTECSTEKLAPLARQIAQTLIASLPATDIIDISDHVDIVGGSTLPYLQRTAGEALIAAIDEAGRKPQLVHALRTLPQQYMVHYQYLHHLCGIPLAASPGTSPHERGIAVDLQDHQSWIQVLARHNWVWRGQADPAHFNFHGPQNADFGIEEIKAFQQTWNDHNPTDLIGVDGSYGPETEGKVLISPIDGW